MKKEKAIVVVVEDREKDWFMSFSDFFDGCYVYIPDDAKLETEKGQEFLRVLVDENGKWHSRRIGYSFIIRAFRYGHLKPGNVYAILYRGENWWWDVKQYKDIIFRGSNGKMLMMREFDFNDGENQRRKSEETKKTIQTTSSIGLQSNQSHQ